MPFWPQGWVALPRKYKSLSMIYCSLSGFSRPYPTNSDLTTYSCQLFRSSLPNNLSHEIERIQRRAMRNIFPGLKNSIELREAVIPTLYVRREKLSCGLFKDITYNKANWLTSLRPPNNSNCRHLRSIRPFNTPVCKTDRFKKSFIISHSLNM